MTPLAAQFFDGRTSRPQVVDIHWTGPGRIRVQGTGVSRDYALSACDIPPRLGSQPALLRFPDGASCVVEDAAGFESLLAGRGGNRLHRWLHRLETVPLLVAGALLASVLLVWLGLEKGVPWSAERIALALPADADRRLGRQALETLDEVVFRPTRLPLERQQALQALFRRAGQGLSEAGRWQLALRGGGRVGANALALPGGIVVLTDEMARLADNDAQIMAVLAHEMGHLAHRHGLRTALQNSIAALVVATLTGDILSSSSFAAALPTLLLEAKYSRDFERQADDYAVRRLAAIGLASKNLADVLLKLESRAGMSPPAWLATHPGAAERARAVMGGAVTGGN